MSLVADGRLSMTMMRSAAVSLSSTCTAGLPSHPPDRGDFLCSSELQGKSIAFAVCGDAKPLTIDHECAGLENINQNMVVPSGFEPETPPSEGGMISFSPRNQAR